MSLPTRRRFLHTTTAAGVLAASDLLRGLPHVSAEEAAVKPDLVRFSDRIEPLVELIEESPRQQVLERVAQRIRGGTSYQEVLAALLLAGVRNVQPRPSVGFKFHCVLVVNSCHLASIAGPPADRWLPIFWALDYFKSAQRDEARRSGWKMDPVDEARVPDASRAHAMFHEAMRTWDVEMADAATAGLVRTAGATDVFNQFARYAARDYRSIGHKAIFLANGWRTLQVIGWDYAEPVMRSLAFALLNHTGDPNPSESDLAVDRPWRANQSRCDAIPDGWLASAPNDDATHALLAGFRDADPDQAAETAASLLAGGASAQSVWDGVFVGSGELLMRRPGIIGLHSLTTANAVRFIWQNVSDETLRKRLLLQACSFVPLFRESSQGRGELADRSVDELREMSRSDSSVELESILEDISGNRVRAAENLHRFVNRGGNPHEFIDQARRLIFVKGRGSHDYKFSSAVLEDFAHVSPSWRNTFLATSVFNLKGTTAADNGLIERARAALA